MKERYRALMISCRRTMRDGKNRIAAESSSCQAFAINLNLTSGIMPVRRFLQAGAKVALGSDVGAGHDLFMPHVIVRAIQVSKVRAMDYPEEKALTLPEALAIFYLSWFF